MKYWRARHFRFCQFALVLSFCCNQQHCFALRRPESSLQHPPTAVLSHSSLDTLTVIESNGSDKTSLLLNAVVLVSTGNLLFNALRPDPSLVWQFRFPRIVWEICILLTAKLAIAATSPMVYLLLAFMLGTTALVDIFVWAPFFALWSGLDNQDCTGGWFTGRPYMCKPNRYKGYGRLLVTLQSLFGGVFYLGSAIAAWGEYVAHRDRLKAIRQAQILHEWHQSRIGARE